MSRKTRRLIWSAPLVAVFAVVGALAAISALGIGGVFANEATNQPITLKVSPAAGNAGRTALVLTWDAPASGETPTGYRIDMSTNNRSYKFLDTTDANTLTYTHSGISGSTTGTSRFYRVFAMNQHGGGDVSTWEEGVTKKITTPGQVKPFDWTSSDPTKVVLNWTAPDDGGADILGYCIRTWPTGTAGTGSAAVPENVAPINATNCTNAFATEGPGVSSRTEDGGVKASDYREANTNDRTGGVIRILPATTYTHSGLLAKQEWSYEVYAVNKHGYSSKVSATRHATTAAAKNPSPPPNLLALQDAATPDGGRIINLYWTKPDTKGQSIIGYEIEVTDKRIGWPSSQVVRPAAAATTKASETALAPDPGDSSSNPANVAVIWINAASQAGNDEPANIANVPYQLRHTYTAVVAVGGATVPDDDLADKLYYRVRTITNNDAMDSEKKSSTWTTADVTTSLDTVGVPDVDPVVPPAGFVPPVLAPLVGADEASTALDTDQDVDGADPADNDATPGEFRLFGMHRTSTANGYRVDISTDNGATWVTHEEASRPINEYDVRGADIKPGKRYRVRLFSKAGGYGLASEVVQDYAGHSEAPGNVGSLTATKDGAGAINMSWDHPTSDGGATIDAYCIVATPDGEDEAPSRGTIVVNDIATSDLLEANCTRFGEPKKLPISLKSEKEQVFKVSGSTNSVSFKDVLAETQWFFRVYGLNGPTGTTGPNGSPDTASTAREIEVGLAADSERNDATTDSAVVANAPPYLTAQDARDTNELGVNRQGVLVIWTSPANPAGAPVLGYRVERSIDDAAFEVLPDADNLNTGETHYVDDEELPEDETRVYRVTSINSVSVGTDTITVTLPLAAGHTHPPGTVGDASGLTTAPGTAAGTAELTWTEGDNANIHWVLGIAVNADGSFDFGDRNRKWMKVDSGSPSTVTGLTPGKTYAFAIISGHYDASLKPDTRWSDWTWAAVDVTVN